MKQREVTDEENIVWVCVQAFSAVGGNMAEKAAQLSKQDDGMVPVICTPNGGAQSVRISLEEGWFENTSEAEILIKISEGRN